MNNKITMGLVGAAIAAMAIAPSFKSDDEEKIINVSKAAENESPVLAEDVMQEYKNQIESLLDKKTNSMTVSENINTLTEGYSIEEAESIAQTIYKELNLAQDDSVNAGSYGFGEITMTQQYSSCHAACHGACHSACHGSRGWR